MRSKIQLALPLMQVAVGGGLLAEFVAIPHPYDFEKTSYRLCSALNAPAFQLSDIPLYFLHHLYGEDIIFQTAIRLCFVWLVWHAVAIEFGGRGHSVLTAKTRFRGVLDALVVIFGAAVGMRLHRGVTIPVFGIMDFVWGGVIMGFYGHDLWVTIRKRRK